jgi:hypothetical protein
VYVYVWGWGREYSLLMIEFFVRHSLFTPILHTQITFYLVYHSELYSFGITIVLIIFFLLILWRQLYWAPQCAWYDGMME